MHEIAFINKISYRLLFFKQKFNSLYRSTSEREREKLLLARRNSFIPMSYRIPVYSVNLVTSVNSSRVGEIAEIVACVLLGDYKIFDNTIA